LFCCILFFICDSQMTGNQQQNFTVCRTVTSEAAN
jgi:hypothetical protein